LGKAPPREAGAGSRAADDAQVGIVFDHGMGNLCARLTWDIVSIAGLRYPSRAFTPEGSQPWKAFQKLSNRIFAGLETECTLFFPSGASKIGVATAWGAKLGLSLWALLRLLEMPKELSKWRRAAATGKRHGTITGTIVKCFGISRNEPLKTASKRLDEHVSDRASRNMAVELMRYAREVINL
jgi:hypothetical protein